MIPIILQKNMTVEAAKPLDAKYFNTSNTPYTSTSQVLSQIPVGYRHTGLTVLVVDVEYWFDASGNLVLKDNDTGLMDYRGAYDASSNTYPTTGGSGDSGAIMKADVFVISVAGTLGGVAIQVGDYLIANTDTPAQISSKWDTLNTNISYVPEDIANKVTSISGASTNVQYPSAKLVFDQLALKEDLTNKVTSISGSSTNTQYPSAKLLYDQLALKQANISLTTTGSSGASTFIGNTLNVPTYTLSGLGGVSSARQLTINGTTYDLSANRTWSVGTVTGVTATSPVFSSGGVTPNITIQQASASLSGYLSATDWTTFNSKQNAITPAALTKTNDTNVTLTLGGSPNTALLAATSLTLGWTGTLADSRIASASTWNAKQNALGFTPENVANKVTSISSASTDTQYPTAKLLYESLGGGGVGGYVYWALGNEPVGGGSVNVPLYGMLYNWYAATDSRNIASSGWHVPSQIEMTNLRIFFDPTGTDFFNTAGGAMKATGTTYWAAPNTGATNSSNLGIRGAGQRATIFSGLNLITQFWNTFDDGTGGGGVGGLTNDNDNFFAGIGITTNKFGGLSIILRKDTPTVGANYTIVPNGYTGNDGNVYNTVIIDGYEWTGALLIETKYRNGDSIPNVTDDTAWVALTSGALCYYNNDVTNAYTTGGISSLNVYNHNLVKFKDNASVTWTKTQSDPNTISVEATVSATGTVTSVTGTSPISSSGGTTPDISISQANTSTSGYLSATDWNTFNSKGSGTVTSVGTAGLISGGTITGSGTITTSMATNKLVGRYSTSSGIMQEITVGSGLTLTGTGVLNNTATATPLGYYGAFSDSTTQVATADNVGVPMIFSTNDITPNGVNITSDGSNLTKIVFDNSGIYNIQFSAQWENTDNAPQNATVWLRKNGVDVPGSSGVVGLQSRKSALIPYNTISGWNYVLDVAAGDYYQFYWSTTLHSTVAITFYPAGSPPPSTASVILTVTQQSGIMAGTGITALNSLTGAAQTLTTGTSGTDFAINSAGTTHTFNLPTASASNRGALSSTDWSTFNSKQNTITLSTTGSSGASTFISNTLNIPNYTLSGLGGQPLSTNLTSLSGLSYISPSFVKMTASGTFALDTTAYGTGTVTSVAALTIGTTGTNITSTVETGTTTPVITLNIPTASSLNRGALSATDWTTFNSKQAALSGSGIVKSTTGTISYISGTSSQFVKGDGSLDSSTYTTLASFTASSPLSYSFFTGAFSISQATNLANGYLTSTDWNTFNNKGSGTVTSVAALTIGTTGSNITSSVANGSSTPVITLNVPDASSLSRGALTSTDWNTFNGKQAYLSGTGFVKSTSGTISYDTSTYLTTTGSAANLTSFPTLNQNTTGTANIAGGTLGAIPYQSAANATTVLAASTTASKMLLSGASAAPTWSTSTIPTSAGATANKLLLSDGTNYVLSTPTFPNASATTRKIIVSDGTNWVASTETFAVPGTSGNVLTSDGTNWISSAAAGGGYTISSISTSTTAVKNTLYVLTATLTLTLPASPTAGDKVAVSNQSGTTTAVIARNALKIMSLAEDLTLDKTNIGIELYYANSTSGWVIL